VRDCLALGKILYNTTLLQIYQTISMCGEMVGAQMSGAPMRKTRDLQFV
jgi:hypothetical protein